MEGRRQSGHGRAGDHRLWRGLGEGDFDAEAIHEEIGGERQLRRPKGHFKYQVVPTLADGGVGAGAAVDIAFIVEKDLGWKGFATVSPMMAGGGVGGIGRH